MSLLTLMHTLPLVTTCSIHEHHLEEKPFILRTCCKKGHFTLSYAFLKSSFRMTPLFFFLCISWIASYKITTPSKMGGPPAELDDGQKGAPTQWHISAGGSNEPHRHGVEGRRQLRRGLDRASSHRRWGRWGCCNLWVRKE
jgi:hypothetical protein